jgi:hypothetical protein
MNLRNGKIIEYSDISNEFEFWITTELIPLIGNASDNIDVTTTLFKNIVEHKKLWRNTDYGQIFEETALKLIEQAKVHISSNKNVERCTNLIKILETLL